MTRFIQLIEYRTNRPDEVNHLLDEWIAASNGKRTATRTRVGRDHNDPAHFVEILEFPSHEDAMTNSGLPETGAVHEKFVRLCEGPPAFTDLDIVRDQPL